ncbi:MAG: GNAT family N-acetyltransferase [Lachnospiraceae bacterium]|nr:GNAT family N-acetyltransferase [Lachnospiraceae bacterium]
MIRYKIYDSHLNMSHKTREALIEFFEAVKGCGRAQAELTAEFCALHFEKAFAVKWYEVLARENGKIVGYIRCLRNPEDDTRWYICEVHVRPEYRNRGIAKRMYQKVMDEVAWYDNVKYMTASVHPKNVNSVKLHESLNFINTGHPCRFPGLDFEEGETEYETKIYKSLGFPDNLDYAVPKIMPVWKEYLRKQGSKTSDDAAREKLVKTLKKALTGDCSFDTIWWGNELMGFDYRDGKQKEFYLKDGGNFDGKK